MEVLALKPYCFVTYKGAGSEGSVPEVFLQAHSNTQFVEVANFLFIRRFDGLKKLKKTLKTRILLYSDTHGKILRVIDLSFSSLGCP
jgi:hypothetical protein